jgi:hypothetical protein
LHPAQVPLAVSQSGEVPEHWPELVGEHCAHAPDPWQAGVEGEGQAREAAEPLSPLQPAQLPLAVSQSGVAAEHCVELAAEHCPQAPEIWQAGVEEDGQARAAPEPLSPLHPAQVALAGSQKAEVPEHSVALVAEHCPQAPEPKHAGLEGEGQARVAPEPLSPLHPAHVAFVVLQSGEVPVHCVPFVAEHCPHAPEPWHAGLVELGHGRVALEPLSPLQATHPPAEVSQTGRLVGHCALLVHVHVLVLVSHVAPDVHWEELVPEH